MQCPSCSSHIQDTWVVCPFCAVNLKPKCTSCSKELQIGWKACPFCGSIQSSAEPTPSTAPIASLSTGSSASQFTTKASTKTLTQKESFLLFSKAKDAFEEPFESYFKAYAEGGKISEAIAAFPVSSVKSEREKCVENLVSLLCSELHLSHALFSHSSIHNSISVCFNNFQDAIHELSGAQKDLKSRGIADSAWGQFAQNLILSYTDRKTAAAVAVGTAVGSVLLPGVGTVVGAALGGYFGGKGKDEQDQLALKGYSDAVINFAHVLEQAFIRVFDVLLEFANDEILLALSGAEINRRFEFLAEAEKVIGQFYETQEGSLEGCLKLAQECVELLPESDRAYWIYSLVLDDSGEIQKAIQSIKTAINIEDSQLVYWRDLALYLRKEKKYTELEGVELIQNKQNRQSPLVAAACFHFLV